MKQLPTSLQSIDEQYQKAVSSGNNTLGEKLALEYATSKGFSIPAYHGTYRDFNVFLPGDIGIHFAKSRYMALNRLNDTEWDDEYSHRHSSKYPHGIVHYVALRITNPYYIHSDFDDWKPSTFFKTAYFHTSILKGRGVPFESPTAMYIREQKVIATDAYRFLKKLGYTNENIFLVATQFAELGQDNEKFDKLNEEYNIEFQRRMKEANIDAILYNNEFEGFEDEETLCYIILNSNNIKSLEPVYKDNKLVPLSKRFDFSSPFFRN